MLFVPRLGVLLVLVVEAVLARLVLIPPCLLSGMVSLGRAVAVQFPVGSLGGDASPGPPSSCQASFGRNGDVPPGSLVCFTGGLAPFVGVDGSASVLDASPVPSGGVGGVRASPVIINEFSSVEGKFSIAVGGACASDLVMSGAMRAPRAPVSVSTGDGGSGAELDSCRSDGHECGGQCASYGPLSRWPWWRSSGFAHVCPSRPSSQIG